MFLHNIDRTDTVFLVIDSLPILIVNVKCVNRIGDTSGLHGNAVLTAIIDGSDGSSISKRINEDFITQLNKEHRVI